MKYRLETPDLSIAVTKTGIELCSIKSKAADKEYMWQADPAIWGSHAPVLFPVIGSLKNGATLYNGESYPIPKHGLIRNSEKVQLVEQTNDSLRFNLKWDEESLKQYPFKFEIEVIYKVVGHTITVSHLVKNLDDKPMLYSIGGHPAFNCPFQDGESYEDYFLEFEQNETDSTWLLNSDGLVTGETSPILRNTTVLPLHKHLFDNDALIFKNLTSRKVSLKSSRSGEVLSVSFDDFDYLGIWAKPGAPFVCIEPWLGITDSSDSDQTFSSKEGILELDAGKTDMKSYSITIHENHKI